MIECRLLTRRFGDRLVVDHADFVVEQGDIFALIGPNGAGKSTTIKMLATLLKPTEGDATICGYSILRDGEKIRPLIGYMSEESRPYPEMTVREYLEYFAAAYRLRGTYAAKVVEDCMVLTDLGPKQHERTGTLSRGVLQRLMIARVLLHNPRVLLLDEPASGLDPRARSEIRELLRELKGLGKTILLSSHILPELGEFCTKVGIMEGGRLVYADRMENLLGRVAPRPAWRLRIAEEQVPALEKFLTGLPEVFRVLPLDGFLRVELSSPDARGERIPEQCFREGFRLLHFAKDEPDLEEAFLRLTKGLVT